MIGRPAMSRRHVKIVTIGRAVRLPVAKNKHACRDESEREQSADIRKIGKGSDVEQACWNTDHESRHPCRKIRRLKSRMHTPKYSGK